MKSEVYSWIFMQCNDEVVAECGSARDHLLEISRWDGARGDLFTALCAVCPPVLPPRLIAALRPLCSFHPNLLTHFPV